MTRIHTCLTILLLLCCFAHNAKATITLEAETATYTDCQVITDNKYSGGKALELRESTSTITFTYKADSNGKYTIYLGYDGSHGAKVVNVVVNGNASNVQGSDNISTSPVDANSTASAKTMYSFLYNNFGKKTISGMMTGDMSSANGDVRAHDDIAAVYAASGKYPALVGFDFMNATGLSSDESWSKQYTNATVTLAQDTYQRGGLPAYTWHWRDPSKSTGEFYTEKCDFKITDAMYSSGNWNTSSTAYKAIIRDIDIIADYFLSLQQKGVACIFRPLHEASGGWFWWGRSGAAPFVKLYHLVFDRMVKTKGVHNLIWVWNAGADDNDWDPGESYYDVVSADIYNNALDYSSNYATFDKLKTLTNGKKIIALSENGPIPDIDKEFNEDAVWSWWMPWYNTWSGNYVSQTSNAEWKKCMNDSRVVTLEDLSAGWENYSAISTPKVSNTQTPINQGIFDLQGRHLDRKPAKGLYIENGKKVVVR